VERQEGEKRVIYRRSGTWPPPAEFFTSDAIGITYYLQKWFQYYLQQWIESRMGELEAKEGVYSLDFFHDNPERAWADSVPNSCSTAKVEVPAVNGSFRDANGSTWAADMSLLRKMLDVSTMTQHWVKSTNDPFFTDLERGERLLLYLYFVIGMPARTRAPRP
jgi:hypothetical protein